VIAVVECGSFARDALAGGPGEVCAVFRRSLYLRFRGARYACLGDASLGRGPLNALVSDPGALGSLAMGRRVTVSPDGSKLWQPRPIDSRSGREHLSENVASLVRAARRFPARDGLGGAISGASSPLLDHAQPVLAALDAWLAHPCAPIPPRAWSLIGLGPGLTPSGDDYLGGLMVGLRAAGSYAAASALWRWLERQANGRTSEISRAHLAAAAQGQVHEALHACVAALFAAKAPRWGALLSRLDGVGHCSGRDGLAGAVAVARRRLQ
jgi:hypothetical protein